MKRRELHLPLTCALIGMLWAICWGMVHCQSEFDRTRVHLDQSIPLAGAGLVVGALVGTVLHRVSARWTTLLRVLEVVLVPVLAGSIAGPLGWLWRDDRLDWSGEGAILRAASYGLAVGLALYLVGCALRCLARRRTAAAPDRRPSSS
jgi:hypothetical protein